MTELGGEARERGDFNSALRDVLSREDSIVFQRATTTEELKAQLRQSSPTLRVWKNTFANSGFSLQRPFVDDIVAALQVDPPLEMNQQRGDKAVDFLLDTAGMGKSVLMRQIIEQLEREKVPVLAIKADSDLNDVSTDDDLLRALGLLEAPQRVVARLAEQGRVVVLIDQLDALSLTMAHDRQAIGVVTRLIASLRVIPNVRLLVSCRPFDRHSDPILQGIVAGKEWKIPPLGDEEIQSVLKHSGISYQTLSRATRELLRTPLHLDLLLRAVGPSSASNIAPPWTGDLATLQDLYHLLWNTVVCRAGIQTPTVTEREETIEVISQEMHRSQSLRVSKALFTRAGKSGNNTHLHHAASWLASQGILVDSGNQWQFLHQTFFDYSYARFFVEEGRDLAEEVTRGDQGLFARSQIVQVLSYLRGERETEAVQQFNALSGANLRVHLRELLLDWFCAHNSPTDAEWLLAQRWLLDPLKRPQLLRRMGFSSGWFERMTNEDDGQLDFLTRLLALDDVSLDSEIVPFLIQKALHSPEVLLRRLFPLFKEGKKWHQRLSLIASQIGEWKTPAALDFLEAMLQNVPEFELTNLHQIHTVFEEDPIRGCTLLRVVLERFLSDFQAKVQRHAEEGQTRYPITGDPDVDKENYLERLINFDLNQPQLRSELDTLSERILHESLKIPLEKAPVYLLEELISWLETVFADPQLNRTGAGDETEGEMSQPHGATRRLNGFYPCDGITTSLSYDYSATQNQLLHAIIVAMQAIETSDPDAFDGFLKRLEVLPTQTTQLLIAEIHRGLLIPKEVKELIGEEVASEPNSALESLTRQRATRTLEFLLADERRFHLGGTYPRITCRLLESLLPHLTVEERIRLEAYCLSHDNERLTKEHPVGLAQRMWLEKLEPFGLSSEAQHRLEELRRKSFYWPEDLRSYTSNAVPVVEIEGEEQCLTFEDQSVGSIAPSLANVEAALRLSDESWRRLMGTKHGRRKRRYDALHGRLMEQTREKWEEKTADLSPLTRANLLEEILRGVGEGFPSVPGYPKAPPRVLRECVVREPERFCRLAEKQNDLPFSWASVFVNAFGEEKVPWDIHLRFIRYAATLSFNEALRRDIAWSIQNRWKQGTTVVGVPNDVLQMLEQFALGNSFEISENLGIYQGYINSACGIAYHTLMRLLSERARDTSAPEAQQEALEQQWELIELLVPKQASSPLAAGIIEELIYLAKTDAQRAVENFVAWVKLRPELLTTGYAQQFLATHLSNHFELLWPFVKQLMHWSPLPQVQEGDQTEAEGEPESDDEADAHSNDFHGFDRNAAACRQWGAAMVCEVQLQPGIIPSSQQSSLLPEVQGLAVAASSGRLAWRRGAAYTLARRCLANQQASGALLPLMAEDDQVIRRELVKMLGLLSNSPVLSVGSIPHRTLVEVFSTSPALADGGVILAQLLLQQSVVDANWCLDILERVANNPALRSYAYAPEAETFLRATLNIYRDALSSPQQRTRAMDVFDLFMTHFAARAAQVLMESDRH